VGLCYEKLVRDDAVTAYERIVRDFSDQTEPVNQARARLAALKRTLPSPATPASMTVQPLTDFGTDHELLHVSPDGTRAVVIDYTHDANGILAVHDLATRQRRNVTDQPEGGYADFGLWSQDGRRVAYQLKKSGNGPAELRVATLDGRSTLVFRNESGHVKPVGWTPDGSTILATVGRPDMTTAVGTIPAAGGGFTPLRSFSWSDNRGGGFRLSPDGRFVAYEEGELGMRDIHVVSLDGRHSARITDHPADDFGPVWSPDSRHLAFTSGRTGTLALWAVEIKDGAPEGQPRKLVEGMTSERSIDWIERGIFFAQTRNTSDLYLSTVDPSAARSTDTPRQIPYPRTGRNITPMWSPDGKRLAFVSSTAAEPSRRYLVVMTPDGQETREFLIPTSSYQNPQSPYDVRWFGNGRGLGFSGVDSRGRKVVFRLTLGTGDWDMTDLPVQSTWSRIEWNDDGTAFYFARHSSVEANAGIFERGFTSGVERLVYRLAERGNMRSLQFSPNRKWLAFLLITGAPEPNSMTGRIMIVDVATLESRTMIEHSVRSSDTNDLVNLVSWSPNGDLLVWRPGASGAPAETLLLPVNGGAPRAIRSPRHTRTSLPERCSRSGPPAG
jgi:Tol biopolymer transport system component